MRTFNTIQYNDHDPGFYHRLFCALRYAHSDIVRGILS